MEDQESKTLLDKKSTNESVKPSPGVSFNLIGLTVISVILTVTYFASGIVHQSYTAISQLNAQAPEPSSAVSYNGKMYASLGGGVFDKGGIKCQNDRYLIPPPGWEIAPIDADSISITGAYPWETHVNVMSNGCSYGTKTAGGASFGCNWLEQSGNAYKTKGCYMMILIRKPIPNPTMSPTLEPTHVPTEKPSFRPTHEPTKNPTFQPSAQPSKEPTAEPTKEPTHLPTLDTPGADLGEGLICHFTFESGITKVEVPAGCVFFGETDINVAEQRTMITPALYICADKHSPNLITSDIFKKYGLVNDKKSKISMIKPGGSAKVEFYSHDDLKGSKGTFNPKTYKSLTTYYYKTNRVSANDNVMSALVTSSTDTLPSSCKELKYSDKMSLISETEFHSKNK